MPAASKLRPQTPLRFCLSCLGTIACWAVWIVLATTLVLQAYVLLAKDLPIPDFLLRKIEARLAEQNLTVAFGRGRFDPSGKIFLQDVRVSPRHIPEPILRAQGFYVDKSLWSFLAARRFPDEIRIDGATLLLPALVSPSGAAEPLVENLTATVRFSDGAVHVDQAAFNVGPVAVTAHGDYALESRPADGAPLSLEAITRRFLERGREAVLQLPRLRQFECPAIDIALNGNAGAGNFARIFVTCDSIRATDDIPVQLGRTAITTHATLPWQPARPMRAVISTNDLRFREIGSADSLNAAVVAHFGAKPGIPEVTEAEAYVHRVSAFGESSGSPVIRAQLHRSGTASIQLGLPIRGEVLNAQADLDLAKHRAVITSWGWVPPDLVDSVLPRRAPRFDPYFKFSEPAWFHATTRFDDGWKFAGLEGVARLGAMKSRGVPISAARGSIEIRPDFDFRAYDAHARMGDMTANGEYWMNFKSLDFRFLLAGAVQPETIGGWFRGEWWPNLWKTFQFPGAAPVSDVDVRGNWRRGGETFYFGRTRAAAAVVLGADFEQAQARVLVRPGLVHAMDIDVKRAGGAQKASGWFARHTAGEARELRALDYDLSGQLEPDIMRKLGGDAAVTLLQPWKFTNAPEVRFRGRTAYRGGKSVPELHFNGRASGGLSYYGFPLEAVEAEGGASGDDVRIDRIELAVAGGFGRGKAALTGTDERRSLGFDLYVAGADLVRSIRAVREFDAARENRAPTAEDSALMKRASGGKLEAAVSAQGNPDELGSFVGSGNLQVKGAELGEVNLFGLLSQVLSTFSLNFSTLKLDMLQGSFRLSEGRAQFDDLRVTGPNSVIEANGHYNYLRQTLDFKAHFKPYEQGRNIITAALGVVMNPLSSMFELQLTGPLAKPNWSVSIGTTPAKPAAPSATAETPPDPKK